MNDIDKNRIIRLINNIYHFNKDDTSELLVIHKNYLIDNVKEIKIEVSHDGYDQYGPKSYLYDMYILHYVKDELYLSIWHRENWFTGLEDEKYYYHSKTTKVENNYNLKTNKFY